MATYSSILAWKIPWTEEHGIAESDMTERLTLSLSCPAVKKKGTSKGNKAQFEETQQASDPDMTGILELSDQKFKTTVINMLKALMDKIVCNNRWAE